MKRLALLMAASAFAQGPAKLTLAEAEDIAARNHPRIAAARANAEASRETEKQLKTGLMPLVSANFTGSIAEHGTRLGAGQLNPSSLFSRSAAGLNITQTLFDFGRVNALAGAARSRASAQAETVNAVRAETVLRVREAFFRGLLARAQVRIAEETVESRRSVAKQVRALVASNLRSTLDQSFAELSAAEAELALDRASNEQRSAMVHLAAALGSSQETAYQLQEEAMPGPLEGELDAAVAEAMRARPELASLRLQAEAARRFAASERRQALPSLGLTALGGQFGPRDSRLHPSYGSFGLNLNIPLFNGNLFGSRRREAELRAEAAQQEARDFEIRIARDLRSAWIDAVTAQQRLTVTARLLEHAARTLKLAQTRYDLGLAAIVELNQAQLSRMSAEFTDAAARYDYMLKRSVLDYHAGRIR